jgi:hypothetical protein
MTSKRTLRTVAALAVLAALPATHGTRPATTPVAAVATATIEAGHGGYRAPVAPRTHRPAPAPAPAMPAIRHAHWNGLPFRTPEAAMEFLVAAYNAHDDAELAHVTAPDQRSMLLDMRGYAPRLRLKACTKLETGAYDCEFWHSLAKPEPGHTGYATFRVAPALRPGWYMTVLIECGDGETV